MSDFDLGRHEAMLDGLSHRMARVENTVSGFDAKLDKVVLGIETREAARKAERRAIAAVATLAGGAGSFLISLLLKVWGE
jgi:uncharacterized protein (UPF0335 family)